MAGHSYWHFLVTIHASNWGDAGFQEHSTARGTNQITGELNALGQPDANGNMELTSGRPFALGGAVTIDLAEVGDGKVYIRFSLGPIHGEDFVQLRGDQVGDGLTVPGLLRPALQHALQDYQASDFDIQLEGDAGTEGKDPIDAEVHKGLSVSDPNYDERVAVLQSKPPGPTRVDAALLSAALLATDPSIGLSVATGRSAFLATIASVLLERVESLATSLSIPTTFTPSVEVARETRAHRRSVIVLNMGLDRHPKELAALAVGYLDTMYSGISESVPVTSPVPKDWPGHPCASVPGVSTDPTKVRHTVNVRPIKMTVKALPRTAGGLQPMECSLVWPPLSSSLMSLVEANVSTHLNTIAGLHGSLKSFEPIQTELISLSLSSSPSDLIDPRYKGLSTQLLNAAIGSGHGLKTMAENMKGAKEDLEAAFTLMGAILTHESVPTIH